MELEMDVEDLLNKRKLESDRIEFKTGWNPDDIYHSVCAFANDYNNDGGGYIVVGVEGLLRHFSSKFSSGNLCRASRTGTWICSVSLWNTICIYADASAL